MRLPQSLLFAATLLLALPAQAGTVFLVQLGSFKTEAEATANWERSKINYPETLGKLFHQNSAITLPPSNAQLYRLQAGPFPSREDAASTCNELAQDGLACFVVESAAFLPKEPPVAVAEKTPSAAKAGEAANLTAPPLPPKELAEAPAKKEEAAKPDPRPHPQPEATDPIITATVPAKPERPDPVPEVAPNEALPQQLTPKELATVGGEPVAKKIADAVPAVKRISSKKPLPWKERATALPKDLPVPTKKTVAKPEPVEPAKIPLPAAVAKPSFSAPVATIAPPPATRKAVLPLPGSAASPLPSATQKNETPHSLLGADRLSPTDGRVEVGEAIAVPLSNLPGDRAAAKNVEGAPEITLSGKRAQGWKASPSKNLLQHASWVQLKYFASEQAALNHWQLLRKQLPNLTREMRVRVTKPYAKTSSTPRVSLALGPFLQLSDVSKFCDHVATEELSCQVAQDLGTGTTAHGARERGGEAMLSRREIVSYQGSGSPQYWVQLGSYSSQREASLLWNDLSGQYPELQSYSPNISQPRLSSSPDPVYRLRTGPFQLRYSAQELCDQLKTKEVSCLVVSG